jgi:hypothetical protein
MMSAWIASSLAMTNAIRPFMAHTTELSEEVNFWIASSLAMTNAMRPFIAHADYRIFVQAHIFPGGESY